MNVYTADESCVRVTHDKPARYRLARIAGELVLQGEFTWEDLRPGSNSTFATVGSEWRTLETVTLDAEAVAEAMRKRPPAET